jgi:hypothetical protein
VIYYIIVCTASAVASSSDVAMFATTMITLPAGPILGFVTILTHWRTQPAPPNKPPPGYGFPVLRVDADPSSKSK